MTPCLKIRYRGNHFAANYKREGLTSRGDVRAGCSRHFHWFAIESTNLHSEHQMLIPIGRKLTQSIIESTTTRFYL
jgi:hypothetical protein